MICVSIARGRHKQVRAEHKHLVEQGAQLVEIRLDYIRRDINLKRLLRDRPCPVIMTCRREKDQGKWTGSEETRLMLLRAAIAEGVEYVDLEEDIAGGTPRYGTTKRIISLHDFRETPEDLQSLHARLAGLDADIVKIATMANDPHDNVRMLHLIRDAEIPTVGICMGEIGMPSRILAGKFGAPFTYATFHHERTLAPGQLSFRQMKEVYNYDAIGQQTRVFGLLADPIGQNLSPLVHNAACRAMEIDAVHVPFRVPREYLGSFLVDYKALNLQGLAVESPHQQSIIGHLSKVEKAAEKLRSVNTLIFQENGETYGYNTIWRAALAGLAKTSRGQGEKPLRGKRALVLGSGRIARAVVYALRQSDVEVIITSPTPENALMLADEMGARAVDWERRHDVKLDILCNCTPVGMHPNVDQSPYEAANLRRSWIVFDAVYNPEQTLLVKTARNMGCRVVTGVDMFVRQAALQFKLFTDQNPPADVMRVALKRATSAARF